MRILNFLLWTLVWLIAFFCAVWATGALYFDFPKNLGGAAAVVFSVVLLAAVIFVRGRLVKLAAVFAGFVLVIGEWLTLKPSNDGQWQPDVAETAWADVNGDQVTVHNVRNCDYRTEDDYTIHWETRTVRLSQISGMDLAIMYWGSP